VEFYTYTFFINGVPEYVGKGKGNRFKAHYKTAKKYSSEWTNHLQSSLKKGRTVEVVKSDYTTEENAIKEEVRLIALYGRKDLGAGPLYNLTNGGDGASGRIVTEEERQKHAESASSTWESSEVRERRLIAMKEANTKPETHLNRSVAATTWQTTPEARANAAAQQYISNEKPGVREARSAGAKAMWERRRANKTP
jgi:hypothetical protein